MPPLWLNGRLVAADAARIAPSDRGFLLADGLFETIRASGGKMLWLGDHLARLHAGAALLGIPAPLSDDAIAAGLTSLVQASGLSDAALRLTLTRGPSSRRGLWPPDEPPAPTLLGSIAPLAAPAPARLTVCTATRRNEFSPLSGIKYIAYGDQILARREALAKGATDALILNTRGNVSCCTVGNIFVRFDAGWVTPPRSDGPLPGLARDRLLSRIGAREHTLCARDLADAHEAVITNSLGVAAVTHLDGRALAAPSIGAELAALYSES
jgi:branched-chain amino acid aminotransferase/4-amino-4-deoxychorismate lyase